MATTPTTTIDIDQSAKQNIIGLVNSINNASVPLDAVNIQQDANSPTAPDSSVPELTQITINAVPDKGYSGSIDFTYHRLSLAQIAANYEAAGNRLVLAGGSVGSTPSELLTQAANLLGLVVDQIQLGDTYTAGDTSIPVVPVQYSLLYIDSLELTLDNNLNDN